MHIRYQVVWGLEFKLWKYQENTQLSRLFQVNRFLSFGTILRISQRFLCPNNISHKHRIWIWVCC